MRDVIFLPLIYPVIDANVSVASNSCTAFLYFFSESAKWLTAYLSCVDELKRAESGLQVRGVCLEVVESTSDAGLEFGWVGTGWALGRDLLKGSHLEVGCRGIVVTVEKLQKSLWCGIDLSEESGPDKT